MSKYTEKAKQNHLNCQKMVDILLYIIAQYGIIAEPYSGIVTGSPDVMLTDKQKELLEKAKLDTAETLIMMVEQDLPEWGMLTP